MAELVIADSGEASVTNRHLFPRYPIDARSRGEEAGFAAVFVVDTAGRVEYATVSFTSDAPPAFRRSACDYLRELTVLRVLRDGRPRRALVVMPFVFGLESGEWMNKRYDEAPLRAGLAREGVSIAVAQLEKQPHCPERS